MSESLVIIQRVGLFGTKEAQAKTKLALQLPDVKVGHSTVAIVHSVDSRAAEKILQYDELIFAQPNEIGLKIQDNILVATPFSSHPFGMAKNVKLLLGETARFEWKRLITKKNIMSHLVINVAFVSRDFSSDIFLREPNHLILLELS